MAYGTESSHCNPADLAALALGVLPAAEASAVQAHVSACATCGQEVARMHAISESFAYWPTTVLRPADSLRERLAQRIAADTGGAAFVPPPSAWSEPAWEDVGSGISCKLLATDAGSSRVSMLVRLEPGAHYPPHRHAGVEELHLLDGELWIDERKLRPGDYNRCEQGTSDRLVWSETGCTCVLITSTRDELQ
jgi:anti-sigma factor ChrR (cupin superfamily)